MVTMKDVGEGGCEGGCEGESGTKTCFHVGPGLG